MTILKARIKCDICGKRSTVNKHKLDSWDHALEIKKGYRLKPTDICPRCQGKAMPPNRTFLRARTPKQVMHPSDHQFPA